MARKHKPEEIMGKLHEAEVVLAQGGTVAEHVAGFVSQSRATTPDARHMVA